MSSSLEAVTAAGAGATGAAGAGAAATTAVVVFAPTAAADNTTRCPAVSPSAPSDAACTNPFRHVLIEPTAPVSNLLKASFLSTAGISEPNPEILVGRKGAEEFRGMVEGMLHAPAARHE